MATPCSSASATAHSPDSFLSPWLALFSYPLLITYFVQALAKLRENRLETVPVPSSHDNWGNNIVHV